MKKLLCAALAIVLLLPCIAASAKPAGNEKDERPNDNYVWILDVSGTKNDTLASGIGVTYTFNMRYVSIAGSALYDAVFPTRFIGSATLYARYNLLSAPKIAKHIPDGFAPDGYYTEYECFSSAELTNFVPAYDGGMATEFDFHAGSVGMNTGAALASLFAEDCYVGLHPGKKADHGFGDEVAAVVINAEQDETEIGAGTPTGVRGVNALVTVYGSENEEDELFLEATGSLKRIPSSLENIYSVMISNEARQSPELTLPAYVEGRKTVSEKIAVEYVKSALTGEIRWPFESLPDGFPEFEDRTGTESVSESAASVTIRTRSAKTAFDKYIASLKSSGYVSGTKNTLLSPDCYIRYSTEKINKKEVYANFTISTSAAVHWNTGFEGVFPEIGKGFIAKSPTGEGVPFSDDYAYMSVTAYGIDENYIVEYGQYLVEEGYHFDLEEYTKVSETGYRFSVSFEKTSDEFASGLLITFIVAKEGEQ